MTIILTNKYKYYNDVDYNNRFIDINNNAIATPYNNLYKLNDYLYEVFYEDIDYEYANNYYSNRNANRTIGISAGACSGIRKGNYVGRNLDWNYDYCTTFIIHTPNIKDRYASIGVAGYSPRMLKDQIQDRTVDNSEWLVLPFRTVDGINEKGVFITQNVVPEGDMGSATTGTNPGKPELCILQVSRYILDHCSTAEEAVNELTNNLNIYTMTKPKWMESHWLIGDNNKTYVVEIHNNTVVSKEYNQTDNYAIMTNFYQNVDGVIVNNDVDYNVCSPHGQGLERWTLIKNKYDTLTTLDSMKTIMRQDLKYTNSYLTTTSPVWLTEFVGEFNGVDLTVKMAKDNPSSFNDVLDYERNNYLNRSRDTGTTWETCHTSIYDLSTKKLYVTNQEDSSIEYEFCLNDYLHGTGKVN